MAGAQAGVDRERAGVPAAGPCCCASPCARSPCTPPLTRMTALPVPPHAGLQVLLAGADGGGRGGLCRRVWVVVRHHLAEPCRPPQPRPTVTRRRCGPMFVYSCYVDVHSRRATASWCPSCPRRDLRARGAPASPRLRPPVVPASSARRSRLLYTKGAGGIRPRSAWPPFLRWPGRCTAASPRRTGPPSAGRRGVRGRQRPASGSPARGSGAPP